MKIINDKSVWEKLVLNYNSPTFLQSWNWGETHARLGKKVIRLKLSHGAAQFILEEAKRGTHLTCPGGPLIPWQQNSLIKFKKLCVNLAKENNAVFVRIRPNIQDSPKNREQIKNVGFIPAPIHMHAEITWQLALEKPEDEILKNMRKTTRYLIRKAQNMDLQIEKSQNIKDVKRLYELQIETARRHRFVPFSLDFLEAHFNSFVKDNQIVIFKSIWKGKVISAALIVFYGNEAIYHYSGSSFDYPNIPANYLLQWEAIKEAKKRDLRVYNFWGISPTDSAKHRFSGVTSFKKGFGGFRTDYLHAHDLPVSNLYHPVRLLETVRRKWRRL